MGTKIQNLKLIKVVDGDTVSVDLNGKSELLYSRIIEIIKRSEPSALWKISFESDIKATRKEINNLSQYKHEMKDDMISLLKQMISILEDFSSIDFAQKK